MQALSLELVDTTHHSAATEILLYSCQLQPEISHYLQRGVLRSRLRLQRLLPLLAAQAVSRKARSLVLDRELQQERRGDMPDCGLL